MTKIVNLFAGSGAGKSTIAANVFAELKWYGIEVEFAPEYAKEMVWEERNKVFEDQVYIFGKQHYRVTRLIDNVDIVVTDSPLLLSAFYDDKYGDLFKQFILQEHNRLHNLNYFVNRVKPFKEKGRLENEIQAMINDEKLKDMLIDFGVDYKTINGDKDGVKEIVNDILKEVNYC